MSRSDSRARLRVAFAAVLVLLSSACGGAQARYADHLARGERYLADGKLEKAGIEFRNAIQVAPKAARARFLAGQVAERSGDPRTALARYQEALELDPKDLDTRVSLGKLFVFAGAPDRAIETVASELNLHPDVPALLTVRAAARAQQHDREGARADAERALAIAPDDADALTLVAALLRQGGEAGKAVALLEAAAARKPASVPIAEQLSSLYLTTGDRSKAEKELRKLIELEPARLERRYQLATVLANFGRADDAQRTLEEAVARFPKIPQAKLVLADFIAGQRSRAEGEQTLRGFIAQDPGNLDLRLGLGALLDRSGAAVESMAVYRDIVERDEGSPQAILARNRIAAHEASAGHFDLALVQLKAVLAKNPRDIDALTMRGNIELEQGNPTAAITDLRSVLRDMPNSTRAARALARAHLALGERELAEQTLRSALEAVPADAPVRIDLAQVLGQSGKAEAVAALLEEGVHLLPRDLSLREAQARFYLATRDFAGARKAADALISVAPKEAIGPYLAGLAADGLGHAADAEQLLRQAQELAPQNVDVLTELVRLDVARGGVGAALARVRAVIEKYPKVAPVQDLLGELLMSDKKPAAAIDAFKAAANLAPKWWLPWRNLALAEIAQGDTSAAIAATEAGLKAAPNEPVLVVDLSTLYEKENRVDDAVHLYESLLAARPALAVASNNLAMLLLNHRSDPQSFERAARLTAAFANSNNAALLDTHGWALYKLAKYPEALAVFERATALAADSPVMRYHLGMAQFKCGQRDKARGTLEAVLAASDSFAGAADAKGVLASLRSSSG